MTENIRDMDNSPRRRNMQIISISREKGADGSGINNQSNNLQLPDLKIKRFTKCQADMMNTHTHTHTVDLIPFSRYLG